MTASFGFHGVRDNRAKILVVDDTPMNREFMSELLQDVYDVELAADGFRALQIARSAAPPDLILLDIMMPGIDGYQVCHQLKTDPKTAHIPVIFLTAMSDIHEEEKGLSLGAADYITKPISPPLVLARIKTSLTLKAAADFLRDKNAYLEQEVAHRTEQLSEIQSVTILAMASLAETRDNETGNHILRTQHYVLALARHLCDHPRFRAYLNEDTMGLLFKSAPLHDIGKIGIPDRVLLKPGKLDPQEWQIMQTHAKLGLDAIESAERRVGHSIPFLTCAKEIAYSHHERWDGAGYPLGLAGDAIPISARLMAVADVYDALNSVRVYKNATPHDEVVSMVEDKRGNHFDPDVVEAFLATREEFRSIAQRFADSRSSLPRD